MTAERMPLAELLENAGEGEFLRAVADAVLQLPMEADVEGLIGASRYERNGDRTTWRSGCRERALGTRLGSPQLRVPKLRQSLPPRRRGAATFRPSSIEATLQAKRQPVIAVASSAASAFLVSLLGEPSG